MVGSVTITGAAASGLRAKGKQGKTAKAPTSKALIMWRECRGKSLGTRPGAGLRAVGSELGMARSSGCRVCAPEAQWLADARWVFSTESFEPALNERWYSGSLSQNKGGPLSICTLAPSGLLVTDGKRWNISQGVRFWRCYCCNSGFRCVRAAAEFGPLRRCCSCAVVEDLVVEDLVVAP